MTKLPITTMTAAFLALMFVVLSMRVVRARLTTRTSLGTGDGGSVATGQDANASPMLVAARVHANFAEYVPFSLILLGLIELQGGSRNVLLGLAGALVIARLAHPFGLARKSPNPARAVGFMLNQIMLLCAALYAGALALGW